VGGSVGGNASGMKIYLYLESRRRRTRIRRIQTTFTGMRALAEPLRFPYPVWRPFDLASRYRRCLYLECTAVGYGIGKGGVM
jgi:hypothetical protein